MKRGDLWIMAGGGEFLSKPRPAVVLQDDSIDDLDTITVCPLTTDREHGTAMRLPVEPTDRNGLDLPSRIMVDRITTVRKSRLSSRIGELDDEDVGKLNDAVAVFLGLASPIGNA